MIAQDLYLKYTDPTGKHAPVVQQHRVWDKERFTEEQRKRFAKGDEKRTITVASPEEYRAQRWSK